MTVKKGDIFSELQSFGPTVVKRVRGWIRWVEDRGEYWFVGFVPDPGGEYWCGHGAMRVYKHNGKPRGSLGHTFEIIGYRAESPIAPTGTTGCGSLYGNPAFDLMHDPGRSWRTP